MATITATKQPQYIEMAYGKNILSLFDTDQDNYLYYAQIDGIAGFPATFDLRQSPNPVGYGHFDLGRLLQTQVQGHQTIESITKLSPAAGEVFSYKLKIGYFQGNNIVVQSTISGSGVVPEYSVLPGRKLYTEVDWTYEPYVPEVEFDFFGPGGIKIISNVPRRQKALTDRHIDTTTGATITDGKPTQLGDTEVVHRITLGSDDFYTLSFINRWDITGEVLASDFFNGISEITFYMFDSAGTLLDTAPIYNVLANGGGPDTTGGDNISPSGNYTVISCQTSTNNPVVGLQPTTSHYYVVVRGWSTEAYGSGTEISEWYRFDIDDGECNDFDHIQVSWLNSLGARDYFTFEKRNDHQISVDRTTFHQLDADWASTGISTPSYNKGETVFGQSAEEQYTANTRYLSDIESQYLKNLYLSPDVKVRFAGSNDWQPVVLTSNQWTERTYRKDKLFQHTITFRTANPINMQQG